MVERTERKHLIFVGLISGMIATLIPLGTLALKKPPALAVGKVNMREILREEAGRLSRSGLSPEQEDKAMKQTMTRLGKVLQTLPQRLILIDAQAVLSPHVPDYTPTLKRKLQEITSQEEKL